MDFINILKSNMALVIGISVVVVVAIVLVVITLKHMKEGLSFNVEQRSLGPLSANSAPTKYFGIEGAPWYQENPSPSSLDSALVNGVGWGWGNWELPYRKAWFDSSYNWFFSPRYYIEGVTVNIHSECNKVMMDKYKRCMDQSSGTGQAQCRLEFEKDLMSCPKMDYAAVGH